MAMISGFGIGCGVGYVMSNTQLSIPFLIIGLGVDDMFVIMSSLDKMRKKHKNLPLPQIIAFTMQHSGTAITITSLTNIVVFLVGMKTTVPALNSYYFTAAPCILMTYIFVVTFFVAVVTLDEQRIAAMRNFLMPCFIHATVTRDHDVVEKEQRSWLIKGLEYVYSNFIFTKFGKVSVGKRKQPENFTINIFR
jgi:Niemann-Pick C1 protein